MTLQQLSLDLLAPAEDNIRRDLGDLTELAESIRAVGLIEPVVAEWLGDDGYRIVAGARRHAAAVLAGLTEIPVIVREDLTDAERTEIMLIENLQRSELTPLEEAEGYRRLRALKWSQQKIAERIGRSQGHVSKRLALVKLPEDVRTDIDAGKITIANALDLAELVPHPERLEAAIGGLRSGQEWKLRQELHAVEQERKVAAQLKELRDAGVEIIDWAPDNGLYRSKNPAMLGQFGTPLEHMKATAHRKAACRAVTVSPYGDVIELCTDPKSHPKPKAKAEPAGRAAPAPKETPEQRAEREIEEALEARVGDRVAFCKGLVKKPPNGAIPYVLWEAFDPSCEDIYDAQCAASDLLGLKRVNAGQAEALRTAAEKSGPLRVALACALGAPEFSLQGPYRDDSMSGIRRYLTFLRDQGLTLSPHERSVLTGEPVGPVVCQGCGGELAGEHECQPLPLDVSDPQDELERAFEGADA